ncbi:ornithine cyclodeaminase family protein [Litorihabitans aurantiacus]|uniref:Ornithine cyclodeaminase n=1 Tax=Litorihabitans aurantiacus TaxID=1930061 RepID=A0AA37XD69_9MICO|nr:hypothetical protein [Litorihabitans aurantiacus]GMA30493.1 ornithine cyclodeaminase [Litorihabitans aurantiacus]
MIVLPATVVDRLYPPSAALAGVREAVLAHRSGRDTTPPRTALGAHEVGGEMLVMPAVLAQEAFAVKVWHRFEGRDGAPASSSASVLLVDPELGQEVLMDGACITDRRTAAMTALVALSHAPAHARVLCVIGAGVQARATVEALLHALPGLSEVRIVARREDRARALVAECAAWAVPATADADERTWRALTDVGAGVRGADVVVAATTSALPVVPDEALAPEVLVCGVGSHDPASAEIEPATVVRAGVRIVDTFAGGLDGAGDLAAPLASGAIARADVVELSAVADGSAPARVPGRVSVFKSVGFAGLDAVAARTVARAALAQGAGVVVDLHG